MRAGAPRRKLVLGIAAQGRTFTLKNPTNSLVGAAITGPGPAGPLLGETGVLGYSEVGDVFSVTVMTLSVLVHPAERP